MISVLPFRFARTPKASRLFGVLLAGAMLSGAALAPAAQAATGANNSANNSAGKVNNKAGTKAAANKPVSSKTAAATKAGPRVLARCNWDRPNANPYMGELPAALDRYIDIPAAVRTRLKERVALQQYDDLVEIRRDAVVGKGTYAPQIRDMHFGNAGTICKTVTRSKWKPATVERGLTYCEGPHCVLVPTVCRNVSRVSRTGEPPAGSVPQAAVPPVLPPPGSGTNVAKPTGEAKPDPGAVAPVLAAGPAFGDVAYGPVFAFPVGPSGTTSIVTPPGSTAPPVTTPPGTTIPPGTTPPGTTPGPTPPGGVGGVVVTPVPEPSTWALMFAGLIAIGYMARRRSRIDT